MDYAFERATREGDLRTLAALLDDGADVDARDGYGQTALMIAAVRGHAEAVDLLVDRGAALDHTAKLGLSALMLAVINGHVAITRALVQAGADTTLRGSGAPGFDGKNALDLAHAQGHRELVEILSAAPPFHDLPPDGT